MAFGDGIGRGYGIHGETLPGPALGNPHEAKAKHQNIVIAASVLTAVALLVLFDHHRVQKDFHELKADLMRVRLQSVTENKPLVVKFNRNEVSVFDFPEGPLVETFQFGTISHVMYDTTAGKSMIVFHNGTTSMHNKRIHGGEIALRSWFGFTKHIHVNCAGLAEEGKYPES